MLARWPRTPTATSSRSKSRSSTVSRTAIAWITLNRPEAQNALTPDQRDRLIDLLVAASADVATRVVVLTANGKGFCTGADLRASRPAPARPEGAPERVAGDISRMLRDGAQRLIAAILDCEKPVIAGVNGTAAGIGAHMAFACDLVVAVKSARFIEVFVRRGLVPDGAGAYLLTRLIGPQKTKELMFFGDIVSADDAKAMGLVNRVVSDRDLDTVLLEWAERLAGGTDARHRVDEMAREPIDRIRPRRRVLRRGASRRR